MASRALVAWLLCGAIATATPGEASEEPPARDFGPAASVARLLASPLRREEEEAEKGLASQGESFRRTLVEGIENGDPREQAIAARFLRILVSPWARGTESHLNTANLAFKVRRPVERPESHPWAGEIRKAALEGLRALLLRKAVKPPGAREWIPFAPEEFEAASRLSLLLVEVGDRVTRDEVARMLSAEKRDDSSAFLMYVLECLYGVPPFYEGTGGICGQVSEEEFKRFLAARSARFRAARGALLSWHAGHRAEPEEVLVRSVLSKHGGELPQIGVQELAPPEDGSLRLVRLGNAALPAILARRARATRLTEKGRCELFIAAVTGKADPVVLRALFRGNEDEKLLACAIAVQADTKDWKRELEAVLGEFATAGQPLGPLLAQTPALALAACHRKETLPALRARHRANPEVGLAYIIQRLEETAE